MNNKGINPQLKQDGILGPKTFGAMEGVVNEGNGGSPQSDQQRQEQQQQIMQLLRSKMGGRNPSMMMGGGMPSMAGGPSKGKFGFGDRSGMDPYGYKPQPMPTK